MGGLVVEGVRTLNAYLHDWLLPVLILNCTSEHVANQKKIDLFREKKIQFVTALDLIECLKQIKYQRLLLTYPPISELPPNISSMDYYRLVELSWCTSRGRAGPCTRCRQSPQWRTGSWWCATKDNFVHRLNIEASILNIYATWQLWNS